MEDLGKTSEGGLGAEQYQVQQEEVQAVGEFIVDHILLQAAAAAADRDFELRRAGAQLVPTLGRALLWLGGGGGGAGAAAAGGRLLLPAAWARLCPASGGGGPGAPGARAAVALLAATLRHARHLLEELSEHEPKIKDPSTTFRLRRWGASHTGVADSAGARRSEAAVRAVCAGGARRGREAAGAAVAAAAAALRNIDEPLTDFKAMIEESGMIMPEFVELILLHRAFLQGLDEYNNREDDAVVPPIPIDELQSLPVSYFDDLGFCARQLAALHCQAFYDQDSLPYRRLLKEVFQSEKLASQQLIPPLEFHGKSGAGGGAPPAAAAAAAADAALASGLVRALPEALALPPPPRATAPPPARRDGSEGGGKGRPGGGRAGVLLLPVLGRWATMEGGHRWVGAGGAGPARAALFEAAGHLLTRVLLHQALPVTPDEEVLLSDCEVLCHLEYGLVLVRFLIENAKKSGLSAVLGPVLALLLVNIQCILPCSGHGAPPNSMVCLIMLLYSQLELISELCEISNSLKESLGAEHSFHGSEFWVKTQLFLAASTTSGIRVNKTVNHLNQTPKVELEEAAESSDWDDDESSGNEDNGTTDLGVDSQRLLGSIKTLIFLAAAATAQTQSAEMENEEGKSYNTFIVTNLEGNEQRPDDCSCILQALHWIVPDIILAHISAISSKPSYHPSKGHLVTWESHVGPALLTKQQNITLAASFVRQCWSIWARGTNGEGASSLTIDAVNANPLHAPANNVLMQDIIFSVQPWLQIPCINTRWPEDDCSKTPATGEFSTMKNTDWDSTILFMNELYDACSIETNYGSGHGQTIQSDHLPCTLAQVCERRRNSSMNPSHRNYISRRIRNATFNDLVMHFSSMALL